MIIVINQMPTGKWKFPGGILSPAF